MRLLNSPSDWRGYVLTVAIALLAKLAWGAACAFALVITDQGAPPGALDTTLSDQWDGLVLIWLDAPIEELLFRMPLVVPVLLGREKLLAPMTALMSIAFGLAHGSDMWHVCTQGGGGLILSLVFLRCGGLHGHPLRGWSWSSVTHALYNSTLWSMGP
jgi:Type II CAAX prenyl endopeptidase Rce1-like